MDLEGKVGIVTGGHKGLGAEVVNVIGEQGGRVVALSRSGRPAGEVRPEHVIDVRGDVTVEQTFLDAIKLCIDTYGGFDFIVNNAGILGESRLHETTNELWDALIATHLTGAFWGCKHAVNTFRERATPGAIVNIGSILSFTADGYLGAYTAMKTGVLGLTKAIAIDYAADNIRCNCLCPGDMETPMIAQYFNGTDDPAAAREEMENAYPGKRMAHPREVAEGAAFLLSERASFINGTSLVVDGALIAKTY
ncbi:SDR family NAD(P)-dependent oxidoreductase [Mycolicibacterium sediminis]|uniref:Short-chain dehydrogenase n=1 Tax=Mycolicibacterium sediminis TaxID=1286180 RepID=A0A7I7QMG7_9MYCO|nr:SDR family oxidoreductase [Mycolicibacterium sediminis]BBY27474.1 short-chain dehydrogenase [Mycolicibacterium sediminis]